MKTKIEKTGLIIVENYHVNCYVYPGKHFIGEFLTIYKAKLALFELKITDDKITVDYRDK